MKKVVLSLFDGISVGKVALDEIVGFEYDYYSSEIDKDAILISEYNHQNIIRIGDVTKVSYLDGVLYTENGDFQVGKIDLLIGGSPCQSFSIAASYSGNQNGLDGKSKLFFEYLRILKEIQQHNPSVEFLLENVKMKKDSKVELDSYLETEGIYLNSSLVSFQKRARYYWTNWSFPLPEDRNISFQDYKQDVGVFKKLNKEMKSYKRMWSDGKGGNSQGSCANITHADKVYCLTTKQDRCPNSGLIQYEDFCRYLSQEELEMAQTLPVGYTSCVSYNKAAKALGNGWTKEAVKHILSFSNFVNGCDDTAKKKQDKFVDKNLELDFK